ncbi:MAG TPA: phosphonopyruvate decarboxylase [Anaerolineales bacterium]|nr:phosphonopyruvate decarboxylase [Anaerolineales bacterium]HNS59654.1 phosphonopyruvate decarboxylase [Anaerolineales bacterium]
MLDPAWLFEELQKNRVDFFAGVPDSLLKDFCLLVSDTVPAQRHLITANEGGAIALATGHHLATGGIGLVYLQNSGLGNAVNPITSLADPAVYHIPLVLLIGWRGEPGAHDEPQHIKQGEITPALLGALDVPYKILPKEHKAARRTINELMSVVIEENRPCALVVQKDSFHKYAGKAPASNTNAGLSRERAVQEIGKSLQPQDIVVSTTGMISRELFEYRANAGQLEMGQDFYTVGSMGHASQIALAIALQKRERKIYCIDGDGAFIMHMGGIITIGHQPVGNFKHIVLNNGAHDSVGGQPTGALSINIPEIVLGCGYKEARRASTLPDLVSALNWLQDAKGPVLLEVVVNKGARVNLGRPTTTPEQNKQNFMKHCAK